MLVYAVRSRDLFGEPFGDCIELCLEREQAKRFIADCLADEPEWGDVLSVVEIDLGQPTEPSLS